MIPPLYLFKPVVLHSFALSSDKESLKTKEKLVTPLVRFRKDSKTFSTLSVDPTLPNITPSRVALADRQSVSDMEPKVRSLETSEIVLVSDDQSENHSSNSDIVDLEADLHGRMESDEEEETDLQSSMLSMLGSDKELAEMIAEFGASLDVRPHADPDLKPPETGELLMCAEDPFVEDIEPEDDSQPIFAHTPFVSESLDFTLASVPISEIISQVLEHLPSPQELPQTPLSTRTASEEAHTFVSELMNAPSMSQDHTTSSSELVPHAETDPATSGTPASSPFEFPVLLVGGAALVAIMGVLTYTLRKK